MAMSTAIGIVVGFIAGAVIVFLVLPVAISRWGEAVPPFGRWVQRRFPRFAHFIELDPPAPDKPDAFGRKQDGAA
jgi:hypothetical protein